jgi:hypothetical protein
VWVPNCDLIFYGMDATIKGNLEFGRHFRDREPSVYWRGSMTGHGTDQYLGSAVYRNTRVRLCLAIQQQNIRWLDCKLTSAPADAMELVKSAGIFEARSDSANGERLWIKHRGVFDVEGWVDSWGLYWRLLSGSVVFKVDSVYTNRMINAMVPWVHFIPIASDLSDLRNNTEIVTSTDPAVVAYLMQVAENARQLAIHHSFYNETKYLLAALGTFFRQYRHAHHLAQSRFLKNRPSSAAAAALSLRYPAGTILASSNSSGVFTFYLVNRGKTRRFPGYKELEFWVWGRLLHSSIVYVNASVIEAFPVGRGIFSCFFAA